MTALLMGNIHYMPHCTQLCKLDTIFHASDTGVTTELQFDNAIQVEWFDKTLSESYLGLKAQSIDHSIFIQQGAHSRR